MLDARDADKNLSKSKKSPETISFIPSNDYIRQSASAETIVHTVHDEHTDR